MRKKTKNDVSISELKKSCSSLIAQVCKTRQPLLITKDGNPIVEVRPVESIARKRRRNFLGDMIGSAEILGDVVSPVIGVDEGEA